MNRNACPSLSELHSFDDGRADEDTVESVAAHLETCDACLQRLNARLVADDRLLRELPTAKDADADTAESLVLVAQAREFQPSSSSAPLVCDVTTLLDHLRASRLLDAAALDAVAAGEQNTPSTDAAALANRLVSERKLTPFQASRLLQGKSQGWVLGDYVIQSQLGAGGMGLVFKAQHRIMKRMVALKVLPPALVRSPANVQRFRREIEALAKLRHPNLLSAYDAGESGGVHYLITESLQGETLAQRIHRGTLTVDEALVYLTQTAQGLACAHAEGIVHRDIKPENLWLEPAESGQPARVKILDFGLAHFLDEQRQVEDPLTSRGAILGTVAYLAPEQGRDSRQADPRSDLYSLGCTLWFMLTGAAPFRGKTPFDTFLQHCQAPIPDVRTKRADVPAGVAKLLERMMAKDPDDRPAQAQALLAEIAALTPAKKSRPLARQRTYLWAVPLLLFAAAALTFALWPRDRPMPRPAALSAPFTEAEARQAQEQWAKHLGVPVVHPTNIGLRLVLIPPGIFLMGSLPEQIDERLARVPPGWEMDWLKRNAPFEMPPHPVRLTEPYYIGETEVTARQFRAFVDATGYKTQAETNGKGGISHAVKLIRNQSPAFTWDKPGYALADDLPVTQVSWDDARAYCKWLGDQEKMDFDLPTEAQWEFAARAGGPYRWFFGADRKPLELYVSNNRAGNYGALRVAQRKPNAFGLFDMLGNVREWCLDNFDAKFRPTNDLRTDPRELRDSPIHVQRGGGYTDSPEGQTVVSRQGHSKNDPCADHIGFRLAARIKAKKH